MEKLGSALYGCKDSQEEIKVVFFGDLFADRLDVGDYILKFNPLAYADECLDDLGIPRSATMRREKQPVYISVNDVEKIENHWNDAQAYAVILMKNGEAHVFWGDKDDLEAQFTLFEALVLTKRLTGQ